MSHEVMVDEVVLWMDQEEYRDEGAEVGGSAESGELEANTQENPHHHPTRWQEKTSLGVMMEEVEMGIDQVEVREEWAGVWGCAEIDERKAKTQETSHPHQTR